MLNAAAGLWQADPAAGYVLVYYAAREVREIFTTATDAGEQGAPGWHAHPQDSPTQARRPSITATRRCRARPLGSSHQATSSVLAARLAKTAMAR